MNVVTPTIISGGSAMDKSFEIESIDIVKEVNRIPYATLVLLDGDAAQQKFAISDNSFFEPGKKVEIKLRYEAGTEKEMTVFSGLIVKHGVQASARGWLLTIELKDAALRLSRSRHNMIYKQKTDSAIISDLISKSGLKKGTLSATETSHAEIVQYGSTDWDFMQTRAEACGLLLMSDDGIVSLNKIEVKGKPKHVFELGISEIYEFEIEVDANHQFAEIESIAWDLKTQKLTKASKAKPFTLGQGDLPVSNVAKALGASLQTLSSPVPTDPKALQAWADGNMAKSRMGLIRGFVSIPGLGDIKRLDVMEIAGVGKRFNGKTLVTGVRHQVDHQGWRTDVQFGLAPERFSTRPDVSDAPAAGLLPAIHGLQCGVVAAFKQDPENEFRVGVVLPALGEAAGPVWARLATPDAGKERGFFFRPEVGDEVVVGFFNDDPAQPVILGGMFGSKNTPPPPFASLSDKNLNKGIVTKSGTTIRFVDDKKPAVSIETPGKNKIVLDDQGEMISLADQHGNIIKMSKAGIEITSIKDFKIDASSGKVEILGSKVDVK
ncbi:MAG: hypothetical protein RL748_3874 [Pseudomonadota bacterium]|jgi:Rhs element Vgr protein